jgi:hypothetical protein
LLFVCLPSICHEPSGCFVIVDCGSNVPSLVGLSILISHSLPADFVG